MNIIDCDQEKKKFLEAYDCYDWQAADSLAEAIAFIPTVDFPSYTETPEGAVIFATTGTDGCHYCMVSDEKITDVYMVCPNMGDEEGVYLIGHSISEVLSYALSILGLFECVFDLEEDEFLQLVNDEKQARKSVLESDRFKSDLDALRKEFAVSLFTAPVVYDRLRSLNNR